MMTCGRLNGLFSIGEDFDDEDLLGADWDVGGSTKPDGAVDVAAAVPSCTLRASSSSSVSARELVGKTIAQPTRDSSTASSTFGTHTTADAHAIAAEKSAAPCLRQISSSRLQLQDTLGPKRKVSKQDDFDDWDVDLSDLDECQTVHPLHLPPPPAPASDRPDLSAKTLRPPARGGVQTRPHRSLRELGSSSLNLQTRTSHATLPLSSPHTPNPMNPRPTFLSPAIPPPPQSPGFVFPGFNATPSPAPSPLYRTFPSTSSSPVTRPSPQLQRPWATPGLSPQTPRGGLFETLSPATPSPCVLSPTHSLHTPVLTNRLVQLVSASNKIPNKRPRSENRPRTRRFPGPAGLLPEQPQGNIRDEVVVSVPSTPTHGALARLPSQGPSSQSDEEDFSGAAWLKMKAEMGLDEKNPSCFLHSYSVVMVLRKAALKQLVRNKVPNMAVVLKSIIHTHSDAKAVFKDPTGEIQGTVHRRLLEDRVDELKVGAVLLLKQVGVFSPSHRNHYLNVTPNNLLRVYSHDGVSQCSTQLPPLVLEPVSQSPAGAQRDPMVSRMCLLFDEEDEDEGQERGESAEGSEEPQTHTRDTRAGPVREHRGTEKNPEQQEPGWDADDDLDELLGELPEDTYSL